MSNNDKMREDYEAYSQIPYGVVWRDGSYYAKNTAPNIAYHAAKRYREDWVEVV